MSTPQDLQGISNRELAEQLYDMLMRNIEPDLLTYNLVTLDEHYKYETAEQRQSRMKRYANAYKEFQKSFRAFMVNVQDEVRDTKRSTLYKKEGKDRSSEQSHLSSLIDKWLPLVGRRFYFFLVFLFNTFFDIPLFERSKSGGKNLVRPNLFSARVFYLACGQKTSNKVGSH